jgi:hypothetical protein
LRQSGLPSGKTWGNLQEAQLPAKVRRMLPTLLDGGFVERAENLLVFGLPGRGKTHFLAALGRELVLRHAYTIHFTSTFKLVQQLLAAKRDLKLESLLRRLDRFDAVVLDDLGYVTMDGWWTVRAAGLAGWINSFQGDRRFRARADASVERLLFALNDQPLWLQLYGTYTYKDVGLERQTEWTAGARLLVRTFSSL